MDVKVKILLLALLAIPVKWAQIRRAADPQFAALWLYDGAWHVTRTGAGSATKPDKLVNECAGLGQYFACAQNVNGNPGGLLVFIPSDKQGSYYTQTIATDGRATGKADLQISGDHWIFSSRWQQENGKIVFYRTVNIFSGKNRIHFEQSESPDGTHWTLKNSGDEVRVTAKR